MRNLSLALALSFVTMVGGPRFAGAAPVDASAYPAPIRVACVGASITAGHGADPGKGYSDDLQALLGNKWAISNFGVSGATLMNVGKLPYSGTSAFKAAHDLQPDVVVILLGTNDTKPKNWAHIGEYDADAKALIDSFKVLASHPRIYLCRLPPVVAPGNYGINPVNLEAELPMIDQVAKEEDIDTIDVHSALVGKAEMFPDRIHPNNAGAAIIARTVAHALTGKSS